MDRVEGAAEQPDPHVVLTSPFPRRSLKKAPDARRTKNGMLEYGSIGVLGFKYNIPSLQQSTTPVCAAKSEQTN